MRTKLLFHKSGKAAQRNYITELHNRTNQEIPGRKSAPGFSELLDRKNKSADPNRSKPDPRLLYHLPRPGLCNLRNGSCHGRERILCRNQAQHQRRRRKLPGTGRQGRFLRTVSGGIGDLKNQIPDNSAISAKLINKSS